MTCQNTVKTALKEDQACSDNGVCTFTYTEISKYLIHISRGITFRLQNQETDWCTKVWYIMKSDMNYNAPYVCIFNKAHLWVMKNIKQHEMYVVGRVYQELSKNVHVIHFLCVIIYKCYNLKIYINCNHYL